MASRYTDTLQMLVTTEAKRNDVGDLVGGTSEWKTLTMCREEPSDGGEEVSTVAARAINKSSNIFFPANAPAVPVNAQIRVLGADGTVQVEGKVMRYKRYKHYGKIWV